MADSVRDLRRTLELERNSRGPDAYNVATKRHSSSTLHLPVVAVAACVAIIAAIMLRTPSRTTTLESLDPLFQPL